MANAIDAESKTSIWTEITTVMSSITMTTTNHQRSQQWKRQRSQKWHHQRSQGCDVMNDYKDGIINKDASETEQFKPACSYPYRCRPCLEKSALIPRRLRHENHTWQHEPWQRSLERAMGKKGGGGGEVPIQIRIILIWHKMKEPEISSSTQTLRACIHVSLRSVHPVSVHAFMCA